MSRYYFDIRDDADFVSDEEGLELPDQQAVKVEAVRGLVDIVAESLPDGQSREFSLRVRNEAGVAIFETEITFRWRWLEPG